MTLWRGVSPAGHRRGVARKGTVSITGATLHETRTLVHCDVVDDDGENERMREIPDGTCVRYKTTPLHWSGGGLVVRGGKLVGVRISQTGKEKDMTDEVWVLSRRWMGKGCRGGCESR